jgi:S-phase kinase-associated protein 1
MAESANHIILRATKDEPVQEFSVSKGAAKMMRFVQLLLEGEASEAAVIDIDNVSGVALKYVLQYVEYHHTVPPQPLEKPLKDSIEKVISQWDRSFLFTDLIRDGDETQHELLLQVWEASLFLDVVELRELIAACVASLCRGKSTEQIRQTFHIENDLSKDEEERMREEARYAEE